MIEFLEVVAEFYNIIVYTSGEERYAQYVVNRLDPRKKYFAHILHRDHCFKTKNKVRV